jgi:hypothetical protein
MPTAAVSAERTLLQFERPDVIALVLNCLAQPVEDLGALVEVASLLEARARGLPVGSGKRLPTSLYEVIRGGFPHRRHDRNQRAWHWNHCSSGAEPQSLTATAGWPRLARCT